MRLLILVMGVALSTPVSAQPLLYGGGAVLTSPQVIVVLWGSEVGPSLPPDVRTFYEMIPALGHFAWLSEYDTPTQHIRNGAFLGYFEIEPPVQKGQLTQEAIVRELHAQLNGGRLPSPGADSYYAVYVPDGITLLDPDGYYLCKKGGGAAFHGGLGAAGTFGLFSTCGRGSSIAFHELIEAVTDPYFGGWTTAEGAEIADLCQVFGTSLLLPDGGSIGLQQLWSNHTNGCRSSDDEFRISLSPITAKASTVLSFEISAAGPGISPDQVSWNLPDLPPDAGYEIWPAADAGSPRTLTLRLVPPFPPFFVVEARAGAWTATAFVSLTDDPDPGPTTVPPPPNTVPSTEPDNGCSQSGGGPMPVAGWLALLLLIRFRGRSSR